MGDMPTPAVSTEAPAVARRLGTLLRLPPGIALVTWRYMWRVTAVHRRESEGDRTDVPPPLPAGLVDGRSKGLGDGVGPMAHRRFRVRIEGSSMTAEQLIGTVSRKPNVAAPSEAAVFHKTAGEEGELRVGDEYLVQMFGPWDGPVRVVHRDSTSFRFATLRGHLEAGQIEFRAHAAGEFLDFEIEAWSRAGDRLADALYNRLRLAKEIQLNMWVHFCLRTAAITSGRLLGGVTVDTRTIPDDGDRGAFPLDKADGGDASVW